MMKNTMPGKESKEFPKDCLKVNNLRVLTLDKVQLEKVPPEIAQVAATLQVCRVSEFLIWSRCFVRYES